MIETGLVWLRQRLQEAHPDLLREVLHRLGYLLNLGGSKALELVPLIRILAGQRTGEEACYFYNRLESNQVRWVSYYFQPDPELLVEDPDVVEFLSDLQDKPSITQPT